MKLTENQRTFAETNHNLVEEYLKKKHLNENDYYDVVIFGYLRAVKQYDECAELRRFKFQAIAFKAMDSALSKHYKAENAQKEHFVVLSLEKPFGEYTNRTLYDVLYAPQLQMAV